jgi:hypothetical protein
VSVDLDVLTAEFCAEMDWDPTTGRPSGRKLAELGLEAFAGEERACAK